MRRPVGRPGRRRRSRVPAAFRGGVRAAFAVSLVLASAACATEGGGGPGRNGEGVGVAAYCAEFARAHASRTAARLAEDSVRVEPEPRALGWLSNLFQPPGSRFVAGYRCRFATVPPDGTRRTMSVGLYLAETRAFAEHTRWESLQIVPIRLVRSEADGAAGHGVFKYLRRE